MAEFRLKCPECNTVLTAEEEWIGMATQCPKCGRNFKICRADSPEHRETPKNTVKNLNSTAGRKPVPPSAGKRLSVKANFLIDEREDNFVLGLLKICKVLWLVLWALGTIGLFAGNSPGAAVIVLIAGFWPYLLLCFSRGIYRNLLLHNAIAQNTNILMRKMSGQTSAWSNRQDHPPKQ